MARMLVISALLGKGPHGAGAPCGRSQKMAHAFSRSSACATGQVLVIAACGRFREFPTSRQVARPRSVPRSDPFAFRGVHCWRQFGDVRGTTLKGAGVRLVGV